MKNSIVGNSEDLLVYASYLSSKKRITANNKVKKQREANFERVNSKAKDKSDRMKLQYIY